MRKSILCIKKYFSGVSIIFLLVSCSVHAQTGNIISQTHSQSLVCKDASCTPEIAGKMNWKPTTASGINAVSINDTTGLTGNVWGSEMGWINLKPSGSGVSVNPTTGALSGYAWSSVCGWINFSPTSYGVSVVTETAEVGSAGTGVGRLSGHAWCGGEAGGWIKFDCTVVGNAACVKTNWVKVGDRITVTPPPSGGGGGGGGGGGLVFVPSTTTPTTTPNQTNNDQTFQNQSGPQNQKNGDYTSIYRSDIDDKGSVNIFDFNLLMVNWSKKDGVDLTKAKPDRCKTVNIADINCDGVVNIFDFNLLMVNWGKKLANSQ